MQIMRAISMWYLNLRSFFRISSIRREKTCLVREKVGLGFSRKRAILVRKFVMDCGSPVKIYDGFLRRRYIVLEYLQKKGNLEFNFNGLYIFYTISVIVLHFKNGFLVKWPNFGPLFKKMSFFNTFAKQPSLLILNLGLSV